MLEFGLPRNFRPRIFRPQVFSIPALFRSQISAPDPNTVCKKYSVITEMQIDDTLFDYVERFRPPRSPGDRASGCLYFLKFHENP